MKGVYNTLMTSSKNEQVEIRRITDGAQLEIDNFNRLLDEGSLWNDAQGQLFIQDKNNALFVAYFNTQMVGFVLAHRLQRFDKRKAEVLLYEIGVARDHRQRGIGKTLVVAVLEWAKSVGADEVWVQTNRKNTGAVALYKSCGGFEDALDTTMYTIRVKQ